MPITPEPSDRQMAACFVTLENWLEAEGGRSVIFEKDRVTDRIRITLNLPDRYRILTAPTFRHAMAEAATVALLDF